MEPPQKPGNSSKQAEKGQKKASKLNPLNLFKWGGNSDKTKK